MSMSGFTPTRTAALYVHPDRALQVPEHDRRPDDDIEGDDVGGLALLAEPLELAPWVPIVSLSLRMHWRMAASCRSAA